jgi:hypothetical protein
VSVPRLGARQKKTKAGDVAPASWLSQRTPSLLLEAVLTSAQPAQLFSVCVFSAAVIFVKRRGIDRNAALRVVAGFPVNILISAADPADYGWVARRGRQHGQIDKVLVGVGGRVPGARLRGGVRVSTWSLVFPSAQAANPARMVLQTAAPSITVPERVPLFCIASGTGRP